MLFDLVRGQIWPKMHVAPGNRDLLQFWAIIRTSERGGGGQQLGGPCFFIPVEGANDMPRGTIPRPSKSLQP